MKAKKIAILKEEYIKGDMQQYGLECYCSDLARLTGVSYSGTNGLRE